MIKIAVAALLAVALSSTLGLAAWNALRLNELIFGEAVTMFNGNPTDGSVTVTGKIANQRSAIDIWPHNGPLPAEHAVAEQVWYRTRFQDWPRFERFSISAMAGEGHYRFNVEAGGGGKYKPMLFAFDGLQSGSDVPFRIYPSNQGVFVCKIDPEKCFNLLELVK